MNRAARYDPASSPNGLVASCCSSGRCPASAASTAQRRNQNTDQRVQAPARQPHGQSQRLFITHMRCLFILSKLYAVNARRDCARPDPACLVNRMPSKYKAQGITGGSPRRRPTTAGWEEKRPRHSFDFDTNSSTSSTDRTPSASYSLLSASNGRMQRSVRSGRLPHLSLLGTFSE